MDGYIDIHNHSMFEADDGAKSMEESVEMLCMAYEDGIRGIILTPHAHYRKGRATPEEIREKTAWLKERIKDRCPGLRLYPGNELYFDSDMPDKIEYGEVCRLAESNYVLVEFSPQAEFLKIKKACHEILCLGITPILAHVEREECLYEQKDRAAQLWSMGVCFQANAAGVLGENGGKEKGFLKQLLRKGYLQFIATDAHDTRKRPPLLSKCMAYVTKKYGEKTAAECFINNPMRILKNEVI